jgi:hypothetical protein
MAEVVYHLKDQRKVLWSNNAKHKLDNTEMWVTYCSSLSLSYFAFKDCTNVGLGAFLNMYGVEELPAAVVSYGQKCLVPF